MIERDGFEELIGKSVILDNCISRDIFDRMIVLL